MPNARVGILGGGQLGMYLCEAARGLKLDTIVMSESANVCASHFADRMIVANLDDSEAIECLIDDCDVITFEKEDIPDQTLEQLAQAERAGRVAVYPRVETLSLLKDKGDQKTWLKKNGFPQLPFHLINAIAEFDQERAGEIGFPLVQKARCGGYDGLGVQVIKSPQDLSSMWDTPSLLEPFLAMQTEISVLVARGIEGECTVYPSVEMQFDGGFNALRSAVVPASLPEALLAKATDMAAGVVETLQGVGVFAVEMFVDDNGQLYINEISPRVHNSGHLTMEACATSQFEQHMRAIVGLPLGDISECSAACMINLLYNDSLKGVCSPVPASQPRADEQAVVHWYGKAGDRQGRKVGHITALASTAREAAGQATAALGALAQHSGGVAA